jgi:hypothetical protein
MIAAMQSADLPLGSAITPNLDQFQALAAAPDEARAVRLVGNDWSSGAGAA